MKASSMQNHFDVTPSKCRQTKPIVWATLLILMSRHADRSSSSLYLADLRSMQYGCKFATVCDRKGYKCINPWCSPSSLRARANTRAACSSAGLEPSRLCPSPTAPSTFQFWLRTHLVILYIILIM